jgi:5'-nucleotidase
MNRRVFIRNVAGGATGLLAAPLALFAADDFVTVTILHTNDLHSHVEPFENANPRDNGRGGLARISGLTKKIRAGNPNTLLFDAGDLFQGTPYYNYFKGSLMFQLMSLAGYDAMTIGNHEFDDGLEGLLESLPSAGFPLISSNYDFSDTPLAGKVLPYKVFNRSGIKIGVYGLGIELQGLVAKAHFGNTVWQDPLDVARRTESFLKNEEHCDLVICLSHLGLRYRGDKVSDYVLAGETSHTDLIIGGHTHSFLKEPLELKNREGGPVLVNQAGWGGLRLGKIDFVFERVPRSSKKIFSKNIG